MKKRKTYEVSVINKTSSKLLSDRTKFYTSDTALELVFKLKEVEYDFDSAELILLNDEDRSLTTRPVKKTAEGFTYDLEDDIVEHYGTWSGQLKFTEGDEVYVSSPVGFRIHNDLYNERPPRMSEVNTWKNLRKIADGLIADIRSELESVAELLPEIESAESERQSAEQQRIEAENVRAQWFENSQIEIENLVTNGNFSNGLEGWSANYGSLELVTNGVKLISDGVTSTTRLVTRSDHNLTDIYYAYFKYRDATYNFTIGVRDFVDVRPLSGVSGMYSVVSSIEKSRNLQIELNSGSSLSVENTMIISEVGLINLTVTFGSGNEPTKEEMDRLIEITGYIDGEYALNNKEMLTSLMKGISEKANKKQEDWIAPTLMNGWTNQVPAAYAPAGYFKDEFGIVHLRGYLTEGVSSVIFQLPVGYRPPTWLVTGVATNWYGGNNTLSIENGLVKVRPNGSNVYPTSVHLGNISFRAEG